MSQPSETWAREIRAKAIDDERERVAAITRIAGEMPAVRQVMIEEGFSPGFASEIMAAALKDIKKRDGNAGPGRSLEDYIAANSMAASLGAVGTAQGEKKDVLQEAIDRQTCDSHGWGEATKTGNARRRTVQ